MAPLGAKSASPYLDLRGAELRGRAKMVFSVAISEIRWAESVPSETVLALVIQNGPTSAKSALKKLGPIWLLGPIRFFPFYSVVLPPVIAVKMSDLPSSAIYFLFPRFLFFSLPFQSLPGMI